MLQRLLLKMLRWYSLVTFINIVNVMVKCENISTNSSLLQCISNFSSNYDLVLISDQDEDFNGDVREMQFTKLESATSKLPFLVLFWPFNDTPVRNLSFEEYRRPFVFIRLSNLTNLKSVILAFAEQYPRDGTIKPALLIMLQDIGRIDLKTASDIIPSDIIDLNCDVYFINRTQETPFDNTFEILELYSIKNNITHLQAFKADCKGLMNAILIKATRRQNFFQVPIVGVVQLIESVSNNGGITVTRKDIWDGRLESIEGFRLDEYRYFRDALNFRETDAIEGKGFPRLSESGDGSLTGMVVQLQQGEADIATQSIEFATFRVGKLTYLHPTSEENLCAYFKQLPVNSIRNIYFDAFRLDLWLVYLAVWILLTLAAILMDGLICNSERNSSYWPTEDDDEGSNRVSDHILRAIGAVCQQGWFQDSSTSSGMKILKLTELLASLVLYSAYCASLVSLFSVPVVPVGSFKDILSYSFTLYAENYSLAARSLLQELESTKITDSNAAAARVEQKVRTVNESLGLILGTRSAYLSPAYMYYPDLVKLNYTEEYLCEHITKVTNFRGTVKTAMILKKGSPFKEVFNLKILQMFERGIRGRLRGKQIQEQSLNCLTKRDMNPTNPDSLKMLDISTAFVVLIVGVALSFAILIIERIGLLVLK